MCIESCVSVYVYGLCVVYMCTVWEVEREHYVCVVCVFHVYVCQECVEHRELCSFYPCSVYMWYMYSICSGRVMCGVCVCVVYSVLLMCGVILGSCVCVCGTCR